MKRKLWTLHEIVLVWALVLEKTVYAVCLRFSEKGRLDLQITSQQKNGGDY
jgi:hypothetical protein